MCVCVCVCVFVARLLQEKCREHQSLFLAFIDLTKAFDTVNRDLLWKVLSKFGCPPHFLQMLRALHDGMLARVTVGGHASDPFDVLVGVKQGCVLASVIFNLFLVAVTLVFRNGLSPNAGIPINFRLWQFVQYQMAACADLSLKRHHFRLAVCRRCSNTPVSYTHLTLPTIYSV